MGLLTAAAMLPKEWEKKLVDMTVKPLTDRDIAWADYVLLSATSIQSESVNRVIARCQRLGAKIVAGGPLFTTRSEQFDEVDHLVLDEAEVTLPLFLEDLKSAQPRHIYRSDHWADITRTPAPLWELVDMKKYDLMGFQYSRGCPFGCDFCDVTLLFGHTMRLKTRDQILVELDTLYSRGWRGGVFVVDDNFIGNKAELKREILPAIIAWMEQHKRPFVFNTQASINLADDEELLRLMVLAGFDSVFVGIETTHEESLAECGKFQNKKRDLIACVRKIQRSGLQVQGGFIVGFDSDPPAIFEKLIAFIQTSGIVTAMVGLLNAPRGTPLYQRLLKENRLLHESSGNNTDLSLDFIPKMRMEDLIEGYKQVIRKIYSPKDYYERVRTLLRNYQPPRKRKYRVSRRDLQAFVKSLWFIGFWGKGRLYYWKLLLWSLFRRTRLFPLAVTYSIYGFHFQRIFRSMNLNT